jgi:hypothetical protein
MCVMFRTNWEFLSQMMRKQSCRKDLSHPRNFIIVESGALSALY